MTAKQRSRPRNIRRLTERIRWGESWLELIPVNLPDGTFRLESPAERCRGSWCRSCSASCPVFRRRSPSVRGEMIRESVFREPQRPEKFPTGKAISRVHSQVSDTPSYRLISSNAPYVARVLAESRLETDIQHVPIIPTRRIG